MYLKFTRGCRYVGEEVVLYRDITEEKGKVIADVVGCIAQRLKLAYQTSGTGLVWAEI